MSWTFHQLKKNPYSFVKVTYKLIRQHLILYAGLNLVDFL